MRESPESDFRVRDDDAPLLHLPDALRAGDGHLRRRGGRLGLAPPLRPGNQAFPVVDRGNVGFVINGRY